MHPRQLLAAIALVAFCAAGLLGCGEPSQTAPPSGGATSAALCDEHGIASCPFCSPELLDSMGFCAGHGVPEAICTRCRDDLEPAFRAQNDWCAGHGLPESQCEACNPGVLDKWQPMAGKAPAKAPAKASARTDVAGPCTEHEVRNCPFCSPALLEEMGFCKGHGVPEAVCTKCRDDLEEAFRSEGDWCAEHGLPESHCEACNPGTLEKYQTSYVTPTKPAELPAFAVLRQDVPRVQAFPSLTCTTDSSVIRLTTSSVADRVGMLVEEVQRGKLRKSLEAPATVAFDSRSHARLAPRAAGTVIEVRRDLGDEVQAGEVLLVLDSAALGVAQSELLQAAARVGLWEQNSQREAGLLEKGLSTQKDSLEAETKLVESRIALAAAEQRLANLGLTREQIAAVQDGGRATSQLSITAPFSGVVVSLDAVLGELVTPERSVIGVADTSNMWAMLDVDQTEIRLVERGQPVLLNVEGWPGETLGGRVTWLSSDVDRRTRTVKVRAEFENPEGILRAMGFGTAKIVTRDVQDAVLIPKDAVQWEGCCNVAFERVSATEFLPRKLRLGYDTGDHYEVLSGLSGGESVVTQGSFLLKTELQKGSIGAGCCEVDYLNG
ncbi:MAG: efflux RND transporter periplasmic adaptor subunit [Planctomycetota bacterium]|nr:efflux RND transporter periplasmic adaptor subunit [Planctomycetota bacterium]